jgi:heme A synthase
MLSGVDWARRAHSANAAILIVSTIAAGLVSAFTLRRVPHGSRLCLTLLSLAAAVCLQAAVGALSAKGANLLWVHVPLGVALFGFAVLAAAGARRLQGE